MFRAEQISRDGETRWAYFEPIPLEHAIAFILKGAALGMAVGFWVGLTS